MTPEEKTLLERTFQMAKENNAILRKMRSLQRTANWLRICYWAVIISLSLGAYYFLQPYIEALSGVSKQVNSSMDSLKEFREFLK